jgi:hypothetical protein
MPTIFYKHLLTNVRNLFVICAVAFHVSQPYTSKDLTLLVNKYMDLSLHQYSSILPQLVQFYEGPICFLDLWF